MAFGGLRRQMNGERGFPGPTFWLMMARVRMFISAQAIM
jgi:hypothetical protein